jgi:molybdate transport repressor ModE-like protein
MKNSVKRFGCLALSAFTAMSVLSSCKGGKGGGGAVLTADAVRLLQAYDTFCAEMDTYGRQLFAEKFADWMGDGN